MLALFTCRTGWQVDECSNQIGQRSLGDCSGEMFLVSPRLASCRLRQLPHNHTACAATVNMSKKLFFTKLNRNSCSFFSSTFFGLLPVSKNKFLCCIFQMFKCCFPYKLFYQHNNFNKLLNADNIICNENVENVKQNFSHFGPQSKY